MKPVYRILADDQDVTAALRGQLVEITITDKEGMDADECEITVTDPASRIVLPRRGVILRPAIGWAGGALVEKGAYKVDEVEHSGPPDHVRIKARGAGLSGPLIEPRDESYHQQTLGDILRAIAARNDLQPVIDPGLAAISLPHIDQARESDLHFVTRLSLDHDAIGTIKEGRLIFLPAGAGTTASGAGLPAATIRRGAGVSHVFTITDREAADGATALYRDMETAETKEVTAGNSDGQKTALRRTYPDEAAATRAAEAAVKAAQRQQCEITLELAVGRPDLIAGQPLTLTGWRQEIDAVSWVIEDVTHTLTNTAMTSRVKAKGSEANS